MISTMPPARFSSLTDEPANSDQRRRYDDTVLGKHRLVINPYGCEHVAKAARGAVHMAFGRHAGALDQGDFQDRKPWQMPMRSPTARFR